MSNPDRSRSVGPKPTCNICITCTDGTRRFLRCRPEITRVTRPCTAAQGTQTPTHTQRYYRIGLSTPSPHQTHPIRCCPGNYNNYGALVRPNARTGNICPSGDGDDDRYGRHDDSELRRRRGRRRKRKRGHGTSDNEDDGDQLDLSPYIHDGEKQPTNMDHLEKALRPSQVSKQSQDKAATDKGLNRIFPRQLGFAERVARNDGENPCIPRGFMGASYEDECRIPAHVDPNIRDCDDFSVTTFQEDGVPCSGPMDARNFSSRSQRHCRFQNMIQQPRNMDEINMQHMYAYSGRQRGTNCIALGVPMSPGYPPCCPEVLDSQCADFTNHQHMYAGSERNFDQDDSAEDIFPRHRPPGAASTPNDKRGSKKKRPSMNCAYNQMLGRFYQLKERASKSKSPNSIIREPADSCSVFGDDDSNPCNPGSEKITTTKVGGENCNYIKETVIERSKVVDSGIETTIKRIIKKCDENGNVEVEVTESKHLCDPSGSEELDAAMGPAEKLQGQNVGKRSPKPGTGRLSLMDKTRMAEQQLGKISGPSKQLREKPSQQTGRPYSSDSEYMEREQLMRQRQAPPRRGQPTTQSHYVDSESMPSEFLYESEQYQERIPQGSDKYSAQNKKYMGSWPQRRERTSGNDYLNRSEQSQRQAPSRRDQESRRPRYLDGESKQNAPSYRSEQSSRQAPQRRDQPGPQSQQSQRTWAQRFERSSESEYLDEPPMPDYYRDEQLPRQTPHRRDQAGPRTEQFSREPPQRRYQPSPQSMQSQRSSSQRMEFSSESEYLAAQYRTERKQRQMPQRRDQASQSQYIDDEAMASAAFYRSEQSLRQSPQRRDQPSPQGMQRQRPLPQRRDFSSESEYLEEQSKLSESQYRSAQPQREMSQRDRASPRDQPRRRELSSESEYLEDQSIPRSFVYETDQSQKQTAPRSKADQPRSAMEQPSRLDQMMTDVEENLEKQSMPSLPTSTAASKSSVPKQAPTSRTEISSQQTQLLPEQSCIPEDHEPLECCPCVCKVCALNIARTLSLPLSSQDKEALSKLPDAQVSEGRQGVDRFLVGDRGAGTGRMEQTADMILPASQSIPRSGQYTTAEQDASYRGPSRTFDDTYRGERVRDIDAPPYSDESGQRAIYRDNGNYRSEQPRYSKLIAEIIIPNDFNCELPIPEEQPSESPQFRRQETPQDRRGKKLEEYIEDISEPSDMIDSTTALSKRIDGVSSEKESGRIAGQRPREMTGRAGATSAESETEGIAKKRLEGATLPSDVIEKRRRDYVSAERESDIGERVEGAPAQRAAETTIRKGLEGLPETAGVKDATKGDTAGGPTRGEGKRVDGDLQPTGVVDSSKGVTPSIQKELERTVRERSEGVADSGEYSERSGISDTGRAVDRRKEVSEPSGTVDSTRDGRGRTEVPSLGKGLDKRSEGVSEPSGESYTTTGITERGGAPIAERGLERSTERHVEGVSGPGSGVRSEQDRRERGLEHVEGSSDATDSGRGVGRRDHVPGYEEKPQRDLDRRIEEKSDLPIFSKGMEKRRDEVSPYEERSEKGLRGRVEEPSDKTDSGQGLPRKDGVPSYGERLERGLDGRVMQPSDLMEPGREIPKGRSDVSSYESRSERDIRGRREEPDRDLRRHGEEPTIRREGGPYHEERPERDLGRRGEELAARRDEGPYYDERDQKNLPRRAEETSGRRDGEPYYEETPERDLRKRGEEPTARRDDGPSYDVRAERDLGRREEVPAARRDDGPSYDGRHERDLGRRGEVPAGRRDDGPSYDGRAERDLGRRGEEPSVRRDDGPSYDGRAERDLGRRGEVPAGRRDDGPSYDGRAERDLGRRGEEPSARRDDGPYYDGRTERDLGRRGEEPSARRDDGPYYDGRPESALGRRGEVPAGRRDDSPYYDGRAERDLGRRGEVPAGRRDDGPSYDVRAERDLGRRGEEPSGRRDDSPYYDGRVERDLGRRGEVPAGRRDDGPSYDVRAERDLGRRGEVPAGRRDGGPSYDGRPERDLGRRGEGPAGRTDDGPYYDERSERDLRRRAEEPSDRMTRRGADEQRYQESPTDRMDYIPEAGRQGLERYPDEREDYITPRETRQRTFEDQTGETIDDSMAVSRSRRPIMDERYSDEDIGQRRVPRRDYQSQTDWAEGELLEDITEPSDMRSDRKTSDVDTDEIESKAGSTKTKTQSPRTSKDERRPSKKKEKLKQVCKPMVIPMPMCMCDPTPPVCPPVPICCCDPQPIYLDPCYREPPPCCNMNFSPCCDMSPIHYSDSSQSRPSNILPIRIECLEYMDTDSDEKKERGKDKKGGNKKKNRKSRSSFEKE